MECKNLWQLFVLENGLLSFENPNYHLDPSRLDDARNSNEDVSSWFEKLCQEHFVVDEINDWDGDVVKKSVGVVLGSSENNLGNSGSTKVQARRTYAALDIGKMGVDVTQGPLTKDPADIGTPDNSDNHNHG